MRTDVIFAKAPSVIDDGRDYTALVIWQMNAGARARSRSVFVPPPVPVQVVKPKLAKVSKPKKAAKKKSLKSAFPVRNIAAVMLGKTLTYQGIITALDKHYPNHGQTLRHIQARVYSMIDSPSVEIIQHPTPVPEFTLLSVDGKFYANSEKSQRG